MTKYKIDKDFTDEDKSLSKIDDLTDDKKISIEELFCTKLRNQFLINCKDFRKIDYRQYSKRNCSKKRF